MRDEQSGGGKPATLPGTMVVSGEQPLKGGGFMYVGRPLALAGLTQPPYPILSRNRLPTLAPLSTPSSALVQEGEFLRLVPVQVAGQAAKDSDPAEDGTAKKSGSDAILFGGIGAGVTGVGIGATHTVQKVGAGTFAGAASVLVNAPTEQVTIESIGDAARKIDEANLLPAEIANIIKIGLFFFLLLFLWKLLFHIVFRDDPPAFAWPFALLTNAGLVTWAALYLFGWGPYATVAV